MTLMPGANPSKTLFELIKDFISAYDRLRMTPVVDDDFPQMLMLCDEAHKAVISAVKGPDDVKTKLINEIAAEVAMEAAEMVAATSLSFSAFSFYNKQRCISSRGFGHKLEDWSLSDWLVAAGGELGEAMNVAKKLNRVRDGVKGNKESPDDLKVRFLREIGDVAIYLDLVAQSCGFTLEEAIVQSFDIKSAEIGWPYKLSGV